MRETVSATRIFPAPSLEQAPRLLLRSWDGGPAALRTEVRVAVDRDRLLVAFDCQYDRLEVDPALPRDRSVPGLWNHDVVEVFVSDRSEGCPYREIEASPLGQWLALGFSRP